MGPADRVRGRATGAGRAAAAAGSACPPSLRLDALPVFAVRVLEVLEETGTPAYVVGGAVRDLLLGRELHDVDLATALTPDRVEAVLRAQGIDVALVGVRFGTVQAVAPATHETVEITTLRREGRYGDARHPDTVAWTADVAEDLARRDFTVNALAWRPLPRPGDRQAAKPSAASTAPFGDGLLFDPFGGLTDLRRHRLRAVGNAEDRLAEDPLRIVRLWRFAAELGFRPEPKTARAARALAPELARISRERVRDELMRLVMAPHLWDVGHEVAEGLLPYAIPLWKELRAFEASAWQGALKGRSARQIDHKPVDLHSVLTCSRVPARPVLRWAALLHDLGKPRTFSLGPQGRVQFHGHEAVSAQMAREALTDLRFPHAFVDQVCALIEVHLFPWEEASEAGYRRLIRRLGEAGVRDLLELHRADVEASTPLGWPAYPAVRERLEAICTARPPVNERALAVDGHDVMAALRVGPSPVVGAVLRGLVEWVLADPELNRRDVLLEIVQSGRWRTPPQEGRAATTEEPVAGKTREGPAASGPVSAGPRRRAPSP